ncbi:two-component hybrid sensor and transmitter protein [Desulforapulum autotrophicum HRM2]|uniref:histidine kinase n=1 Tax=Desulforapulum autotrophicum (strain ATCC 43914 / DSM 3382 / VKM B-1955 / HRM2) TaxID=177437 RepID=C0QH20_DESAH|nr:ATP-binding protein [Desulforapulum autotrophicum]ACN15669.1 two-component hybrid sensor and transmitter protein [Desulforapulum autotrophicum HRM2]
MKIKTRFFIVIFIVVLGLFSIEGLACLIIYKIETLRQADTICKTTLHKLKELQLLSAELLSTNDLDTTFTKWRHAHSDLFIAIEALNGSDNVHKILATQNKKSVLDSLYAFWMATRQKLNEVAENLEPLINEKDHSKDGLILQYLEEKSYVNLTNRNNVYALIRYLRSEFEVKLTRLTVMVYQEIKNRDFHLILQIAVLGGIIAICVSLILVSFLRQLQAYLKQLHHSMEIIGRGDLSEKLEVSGNDELSQISGAINLTTDNLKRLHTVLEQRVNELSLAKEEAEKASRAKNVFLANMSHEFRTPLNAIIGFSSHIAQSAALDPEERKHLSIISNSGNHLLTLINSVLAMSKIEAGKTEVNERTTNLQDLLADIHAMFSLKAAEKALSFDLICHPDLPAIVQVDDVKLWQILINLINNAIKFTARGGVKVIVEKNDTPEILFKIRDTGPGMAKDEQAMIFDPFVQLATDQGINEGTGLGLAICRSYIHLMGGEVKVDSVRGKGSTFFFSIPLKTLAEGGLFSGEKQFIPVVDDLPPGSVQEGQTQENISPELFEKIPPHLLDGLEQAVVKAEMDKISLIIGQVGRYNKPLAHRFEKLADIFGYNQIGALLKYRHMGS